MNERRRRCRCERAADRNSQRAATHTSMATSSRKKVVDIDVRELVLIADALASTVATSFGPLPNEKLLVSNTRKVIISSSGATILARLVGAHPIARLVLDCAQAHVRRAGDGASAFVLGVAAALRAADAELRERPALERARHRRHLLGTGRAAATRTARRAAAARAPARCAPASEPAALRRIRSQRVWRGGERRARAHARRRAAACAG